MFWDVGGDLFFHFFEFARAAGVFDEGEVGVLLEIDLVSGLMYGCGRAGRNTSPVSTFLPL